MYNINSNKVLISTLVITTIILSSWNLLQWMLGANQIYTTVAVSSSEFQSIHSWLPLIKSVKSGYLFSSQPNIDMSVQAFLFYPYLTIWFYGLMGWLIGMKGIVAFSTVVFPVCSFYLLYRIFSRQLSDLWSIAISSTCILAFSDWPFRSFLIGMVEGLPLSKLATIQPLEIAHYPIPSLSVTIFLLLFYHSTVQKKLTFGRITLFTSLWGLFSQVHAVDALYGLAFWFIYFPVLFYRQSGKQLDCTYIKTIVFQALIGLLFVAPIIISWNKPSVFISVKNIGLIDSGSSETIAPFYFAAYFFLPLALTAVVFLVKKIDPHEILTRFIHVYILLFVEIVLVTSSLVISKNFDMDIVQTRIALFFLHFYYYAPFLYLVTRPPSYTYSHGFEAKGIAKKIEHGMDVAFNRLDKIYLTLIIVFLYIFAGTSSFCSYKHYKDNRATVMEEIMDEYNEIINVLPEGSMLVAETPAINLLPPIDLTNYYKTLWISRFTHDLSSDEFIDRLLLYAHIYNWPKEKFVQFLLPGQLQERRGAIVDLSNQKIHGSGVGYWLVYHKHRMGETELENFESTLSDRYDNINIENLLSEYGVTHIYSKSTISTQIPLKAVTELDKKGFLYHVDI